MMSSSVHAAQDLLTVQNVMSLMEKLTQEKEELSALLIASDSDRDHKDRENAKLRRQLEASLEEVEFVQIELRMAKEDVDEYQVNLDSCEQQISKLDQELIDVEETHRKEVRELQLLLKKTEASNEMYKRLNKSLATDHTSLKKKCRQLKEQVDELKAQVEDLETVIKEKEDSEKNMVCLEWYDESFKSKAEEVDKIIRINELDMSMNVLELMQL